jgi:chromosome segregation ATPase
VWAVGWDFRFLVVGGIVSEALDEGRVRDIVKSELAQVRDALSDVQGEIRRVDAARQESSRQEADERRDLRAKISTVLDIVNSNALGVTANRENIVTLTKSTQETLDQLQRSTQEVSSAVVTLTGRIKNTEGRQDTLVSRLEWHDREAAETRKIAESAAGEITRTAADLSDVLIRMGELGRTVEKLALLVGEFQGRLEGVVTQNRPLVDFARMAKERQDRRAALRRDLVNGAKTKPVRAGLLAVLASVSGLGVVEIVEFLIELF